MTSVISTVKEQTPSNEGSPESVALERDKDVETFFYSEIRLNRGNGLRLDREKNIRFGDVKKEKIRTK